MSTEQNKALYRRFIEEGFNQGRLETLDEVLATGYVNHDAPPGTSSGADGVKQIIQTFRSAFPDLRIEIEEQVAEGDAVTSRATFHGTHNGPLFGIPATGRRVTMPGLTMVRVANGRIQEAWVKNDTLGLLQQLGAERLPMPARS
ncbi:MAG: ester cyclase [Dehalococcoidia bacterium]